MYVHKQILTVFMMAYFKSTQSRKLRYLSHPWLHLTACVIDNVTAPIRINSHMGSPSWMFSPLFVFNLENMSRHSLLHWANHTSGFFFRIISWHYNKIIPLYLCCVSWDPHLLNDISIGNRFFRRNRVELINPGILVRVRERPRNIISHNLEPEPALDMFWVRPRAYSLRPVCT